MNFKTTYILFGLLGAVLAVFAVVLWLNPLPPENIGDYILPSLHSATNPVTTSDVTEVIVERRGPPEEKWVFVKDDTGDKWTITAPRKMRADQSAIRGLLNQVFEAKRDSKADKPPQRDKVGLDPPAQDFTLKLKNGKEVKLEVGTTTGGTQSAVTYVVSSDNPREIAAVLKSQVDDLQRGLNAYRDRSPLTSREGDIQEVTLTEVDGGKDKEPPLKLEKRDTRWYYAKSFAGEADREGDSPTTAAGSAPSGVQALLNDLTSIRVEYRSDKENDFVKNDVPEPELAKYNLGDKNKILKVQLKVVEEITRTKDTESKEAKTEVKTATITLLVGVDKEFEDKDDKTKKFFYARRADENDVIRVPVKNVMPLLKLLDQPDALRDRHLVRLDTGKQIDAVNIKNDAVGFKNDQMLEFRHPISDKPWELWQGNTEQKIDEKMIKGLLTLLTERRKDVSFDAKGSDSALGLDKPAAEVSLWIDGIVKDEKKEDKKDEKKEDKKEDKPAKPKLKAPEKPNYQLLFAAPRDRMAKDVVVKRVVEGEEPTLLRVPVVIYDRVVEGPLAYLDKSLPKFNSDSFEATKNVTKLIYEQGGKVTEVTREKGEGPWKIVKPADLAGREADNAAIESILQRLNDLQASKLVAQKSSPEDLDKKYGLKSPSARAVVTVTRDNKPTTYEFDFGKEEGNELYAKQSQRGTIFTVDKSVLGPFKSELLTKRVLSFDVSKVKSVKLTGWQKLLGAPFTLEVDKDGSGWTAKAPKGFKLDPKKIDALLGTLSDLRAEKFVSHGAKPKPEQELEVDQGALRIEVVVEGEKQPLTLTIGKLEGDGYLAISDKVPGDIFTIAKMAFEGVVSKPAHFSP